MSTTHRCCAHALDMQMCTDASILGGASPLVGARPTPSANFTKHVDVLIGVTGSGLTNLAFLEPEALVIELAAKTYDQTYFDTLVMR